MLKPIKIFLHKVSAGLAEHVCLSSLKGIKRLRSPLQFTHYSPWPVNGFVIMGCPLWILSNCPLSRSKSLREYADCVRIILTIDNGWWRIITCLYCPRAHMRPHGAPEPPSAVSFVARPQESRDIFHLKPSNHRLTFPSAIQRSVIFVLLHSSNLPASRMKHGATGPAGERDLRAWAAAVIWRWEVAKQRSEKNDREREQRRKALETRAFCHEKWKRIEFHACGFGCVERLACSCQVHKSVHICLCVWVCAALMR